jgi:hypothetical protein
MDESTPRTRPQLSAFSNRKYTASSLGPQNRIATPQPQQPTARKLTTREEFARGALNASSALQPSRAAAPSLAANGTSSSRAAMPDIFAPGASPAVKKARATGTSASPSRNGTAKSSAHAELFVQRIPDPPEELTGEALAQKIPRHLQASTVYADQYLGHLVPRDFNDEQRRQFFCILDCRRLKVAAAEIFAKKDWKLNIMNFAKEYEKSRSMIMLRYGLYEFKNVKPSAEVLRKWRAAHGLPDPQDDGADGVRANGFPSAAKRKADSQLTRDASSPNKTRRRAYEQDEERHSTKNKRKAYVSDEADEDEDEQQPLKLHKSTSSATKSLFQSVADNSGTFRTPDFGSQPAKKAPGTAPVPKANLGLFQSDKPGLFASSSKPSNGQVSIFDKPTSSSQGGSNIFGHLSGQNSADNDSSDDEAAGDDTAAAKPAARSGAPAASGLFGSSNAASQDSTPSRSLFNRVGAPSTNATEEANKSAEKPTDQTWNAGAPIKFAGAGPASNLFGGAQQSSQNSDKTEATTAGSQLFSFANNDASVGGSKSSLFGAAGSTPQLSALFGGGSSKDADAPKTTQSKPSTGLFGAAPTKPAEPAAPAAPTLSFSQAPADIFGPAATMNKTGLFSGSYTAPDSEADRKPSVSPAPTNQASPPPETTKPESTQPPPSAIFGAAGPNLSGSGLFQGSYSGPSEKPAATAAPKTDSSSAAGLFGAPKTDSSLAAGMFGAPKTDSSSVAGLFGAAKPAEATPGATPSTGGLFGASKPAAAPPAGGLFGAKPAESTPSTGLFGSKPVESASSTGLFGAKPAESMPSTGLFGAKPADAAPSAGLFGAKPASTAPSTGGGLFGSSTPATTAPTTGLFGSTPATAAPASNLFGATTAPASTGLFGTTTSATTTAGNLFGSTTSTAPAASSLFGAPKPAAAPPVTPSKPSITNNAPIFSFGGADKPAESTNLFGASNNGPFGGSPMKTDDNSPAKKPAPVATSGPIFSFGGASAAPSNASASTLFGNTGANTTQSSGNLFGNTSFAAAPASAATPTVTNTTFSFGGGGGGGGNTASQGFNNPFANNVANGVSNPVSATSSFDFNFGGGGGGNTEQSSQATAPATGGTSFTFAGANTAAAAPSTPTGGGGQNMFSFDGNTGQAPNTAHRVIATPRRRGASPAVSSVKKPFRAGAVNPGAAPTGSQPSFNFGGAPAPQLGLPTNFSFGQQPQQQQQQQQSGQSIFNLQSGGPSTSGASEFQFNPSWNGQ